MKETFETREDRALGSVDRLPIESSIFPKKTKKRGSVAPRVHAPKPPRIIRKQSSLSAAPNKPINET